MTLSDQARLDALDSALKRILEDLGADAFDSVRCEPNSERFHDIPQTTWLELEGLGYIRAAHAVGSPGYFLTGQGWIAALKASGAFDSEPLRVGAITLRAALYEAGPFPDR